MSYNSELITELLNNVVSLRDYDDIDDPEMVEAWEAAADVMERAGKELKRLSEELEDAEDRRGNEYLKLEDTVAEQAAVIEAAIKVTDDMRSRGWHVGKTVPDLGEKLYRILDSTEGTR